ncbi:MAG TPA: acyl-CoA dehydrogenase family protein [Acidimicrobiales bacterium]|nr:acyl-CoA dehydrogenase family protein [Acidimicrobiales bacterium]
MTAQQALDVLEGIIGDVIGPRAAEVDSTGAFPRAAIDALGKAGLLGLISSPDVGGMGLGPSTASAVIERIAQSCGSTSMVVTMHFCATAAIEAHGDDKTRKAIAGGSHLSTLAFSEQGSRSHFWAAMGTARADGDSVVLDAEKSWVTSAGETDSYVWTSKPLDGDAPSTLWLVPNGAPGLKVSAPFDGLGLRGNASSPMSAVGATVAKSAMLGADGGGLDVALGAVMPWFQLLNASMSLGTMEAATAKATAHATSARLEHLGQSLAAQPQTRARLARMRFITDQTRAFVADTAAAMETAREDAMLRVLESKAIAAENALEVTELAMRVGGGAAFRKDIGIERNFRDARAAAVMAPTTDALSDFVGRIMCGMPLFGEVS